MEQRYYSRRKCHEQIYSFNTELSGNPIKKLFSKGEKDSNVSKNRHIKECAMLANVEISQLYKVQKQLKTIKDIGGVDDGVKKYKYFAIVSADGDGMTDLLQTINNSI